MGHTFILTQPEVLLSCIPLSPPRFLASANQPWPWPALLYPRSWLLLNSLLRMLESKIGYRMSARLCLLTCDAMRLRVDLQNFDTSHDPPTSGADSWIGYWNAGHEGLQGCREGRDECCLGLWYPPLVALSQHVSRVL